MGNVAERPLVWGLGLHSTSPGKRHECTKRRMIALQVEATFRDVSRYTLWVDSWWPMSLVWFGLISHYMYPRGGHGALLHCDHLLGGQLFYNWVVDESVVSDIAEMEMWCRNRLTLTEEGLSLSRGNYEDGFRLNWVDESALNPPRGLWKFERFV